MSYKDKSRCKYLYVDLKNEIDFHTAEEKQAYLIAIEGGAEINKIELNERDALEITEKNSILNNH